MQRNQRRFAVQTFTVWRVAQHCTVRPFRQRIGQLRDIFHLKGDQFTNPRKTGVSARTLNHPGVAVRTVKMRAILCRPLRARVCASAFTSCQIASSCCAQPLKPQRPRCKPGARSVASIAASISNVPEPHIGSSSGVPGCQPDRITIAAARVSLIGAIPARSR